MSTRLIVALIASLFLATSYAWAVSAKSQIRYGVESGQSYGAADLFDRAKGHIE